VPQLSGLHAAAKLTARNGTYDEKGLRSRGNGLGERSIRRFVGEILLASEEAQERSALLGDLVADRAAQHRITGLKRVKDRALRDRPRYVQADLSADIRQRSQMIWKYHSNHDSVIT